MGASRKLQGEIDRVLKKVQEGVDVFDSIWNKVYDTENANQKEKFEADLKKEIKKLQRYRDQIKTWIQSSEIKDKKILMDARKLIEREMERFKVCEKETKTKAFSKEGLGQQPKTDPKEKAKSETRDWLNNVVGDLENQIDNFEAEVETFSGKKGKTKNPRLTHLEASIGRHKAHIKKLELILRLLDNDELSPDQVNDLKEFLEDYVECNQDDFERFDDVDAFYSSLPLDKVEGLEDLVTLCSSGLAKAGLSVTSSQNTDQDPMEETTSEDSNVDITPKTPPSKSGAMGSLLSTSLPSLGPGISTGPSPVATPNSVKSVVGGPSAAAILSSPVTIRGVTESTAATTISPSVANSTVSVKGDDANTFPGRKPSPAIPEVGVGRGIGRGLSSQVLGNAPMSSATGPSSSGSIGSSSTISDTSKRNTSVDERGRLTPPLVSPLSNRMLLQQVSKSNDGPIPNGNFGAGESAVIGGRVLSPSVASGVQWRPPSTAAFQNQSEMGQFRGRPEIVPDQREKFLQRLQQVNQQGRSSLLSVPLSGVNQKQFPTQQQNSILHQFNNQSSSLSPQLGIGLNMQSPGFSSSSSTQIQTPTDQQSSQQPVTSSAPKDADVGQTNKEDEQPQQQLQQQSLSDDLNIESTTSSSLSKIINDEESKLSYTAAGSGTKVDGNQLPRDTDLSPGQPLQPIQPSASPGVIGRRSVSDLGAIGDNLSGSVGNPGVQHDQIYNMQMLDAAFYKLPQPKDSERARSYVPKHPAVIPPSFPQTQASIVENPAFWERMSLDPLGVDTLFFAFYYQQNTYQQYLAARELKRQSWRYHRKYNTWFQRHVEPKVTNDEYEKGTYVYFDFHIADDGPQHGWCQRIKTEFTFEYNYLEDELVV